MAHSAQMLKYIETGRDMELRGLRFYRNAFKKVEDANSRGLLQFLIGEEEQHLAYFTRLERNDPPIRLKDMRAPLFRKSAYKRISRARGLTVHIFDLALAMEEKGIRFYSQMATRTRDRNTKKFLVHIANMEKQHFRLIKDHQRAIYDAWYWQAMEMPALNT